MWHATATTRHPRTKRCALALQNRAQAGHFPRVGGVVLQAAAQKPRAAHGECGGGAEAVAAAIARQLKWRRTTVVPLRHHGCVEKRRRNGACFWPTARLFLVTAEKS